MTIIWIKMVQTVKNLPAVQEIWFQSLGWEDSPGEFHGQRSLEGYSPWGCKKLDMTEQLTFFWTHFFVVTQADPKDKT